MAVLLTLVACVHLALLALLAMQPSYRSVQPAAANVFVSLDTAPPGVSVAPAATASPSASVLMPASPPPDPSSATGAPTSPLGVSAASPQAAGSQPVARSGIAASAMPASSAPATGSSGGCDIEQQVQDNLSRDPSVLSALQSLPSDAKSVANAVQLWNDGWITPPSFQPPGPLAPLEAAITRTVAAAKPSCAAQAVQGPRLILLAAGDQTYVITLGSGRWRWADVLATPAASEP